MGRGIGFAVAVVVGSLTSGLGLRADQARAQTHNGQYAEADIAYGLQVYTAQCALCHGPQGDAVSGVALRSGKFRNAVIDRDLERFIRTGSHRPACRPSR